MKKRILEVLKISLIVIFIYKMLPLENIEFIYFSFEELVRRINVKRERLNKKD